MTNFFNYPVEKSSVLVDGRYITTGPQLPAPWSKTARMVRHVPDKQIARYFAIYNG
jgi:hypothetical protein